MKSDPTRPVESLAMDQLQVRPSGLLAGTDRALRRGRTILVSPDLWARLRRTGTPDERRRLLDAVPQTTILDPPVWGPRP
jgi:hypothetical protein